MKYLDYNIRIPPTGMRKVLYLNWPLLLSVLAVGAGGFVMLYSVAGGNLSLWAEPQMSRFALGVGLMLAIALTPIWFWRGVSVAAYLGSVLLLAAVEVVGITGMGAQRWLDLGVMRLQPSELTKITLVMVLAAYYHWLPIAKTSRPLWILPPLLLIALPTALVLRQPDLGTALLLVVGGMAVLFLAGLHWGYFVALIAAAAASIAAVFVSRGTGWQILHDFQYRRIDTYIDPSADPLGAGYHITQSQIALGAGGWTGRGFMQGTQSYLNFLPERHTDFIFATLAEQFGFLGSMFLLGLYGLILFFCIAAGLRCLDRFSTLLTLGLGITFFLFVAVNISMVTGLIPVVGVPLPLISYGGSAMLVLMIAFGLIQSAQVHRPR
ncbi:MAG: rod shape-determining protein RodA [Rhodobacteraceae bacterium]|nr:rod shape-determining protein RodA [Paracoccaceae bacterium]